MRKLKLKALVAAVSFAITGTAGAAIDGSTTGNGELFFSVWDSSSQTSYTRDLGTTLSGFATANVAGGSLGTTASGYSLSFAADSTLSSWLTPLSALAKAGLQWNVAAMDGASQNRYLTTASATPTLPVQTSGLNLFNDNADTYIANVNSGPWVAGSHAPTNGSSVIAAAGNANGYAGAAVWGNNWSGQAAFNNAGNLGGSLFFYLLFGGASNPAAPGLDQFDNANGASTWTFANDGTLTFNSPAGSPVPVPGALLLLGSGLLGLFGVARRKREPGSAKLAVA